MHCQNFYLHVDSKNSPTRFKILKHWVFILFYTVARRDRELGDSNKTLIGQRETFESNERETKKLLNNKKLP